MKAGRWNWIVCLTAAAMLPAFASTNVSASSPAPTPSASKHVALTHETPFLPLTAKQHAAAFSRTLKSGGGAFITKRGNGTASNPGTVAAASAAQSSTPRSKVAGAPLVASTPPDELAGFAGTAQASTIHAFGTDQEVTPPNEDVAAGPGDVVEVVNSTVEVFSRAGAPLPGGFADLNSFMEVTDGYHSSDPRVIYDASGGRFWLTITEVPDDYQSPNNCPEAQPILVAVSGSSNPLPLDDWTVYALPLATPEQTGFAATEFGDQPGLGISSNTVTVSFDDYACDNLFTGSEIDILQKTDYENNTHGSGFSLYYFYDGPFAPQPVQAIGSMSVAYIVSNQSDCLGNGCGSGSPDALVQAFTGTPEDSNVVNQTPVYVTMTATAVNDSTGFLPPADQQSPSDDPQLQTNDDRFLNAVWENGEIWTADGTSCEPSGDTVQRDCLNYLEIAANSTGSVTLTPTNQLNNIGINGVDLFYPAVSVDSAGDMITVFDESSTTLNPSIMDASIPSSGSTLSTFQLLHNSSTYYNGNDLFAGACDPVEGCRWGDYSGAAQDPANPKDVWVVSGSEDGTAEGLCTTNGCWNTRIYDVTVSPPTITSLNPSFGAVAGGQTVTVSGTDFGTDTTSGVTFGGATIAISALTPTSFTLVTPPSGGVITSTAQVQATDSVGASTETAASLFTYVGLSNYTPVTPFRILDTRPGGLGAGAVRSLQVTGVGTNPIPDDATAVVVNVTAVAGTASSLLTVYPYGAPRPNASNLNFPPGVVYSNLVTVTVGASAGGHGSINIYNALGSVNVIVDAEGYFTQAPSSQFQGLFHPITPFRVCDTRKPATCDGHSAVGSAKSIVVTVASAGGIPNDSTAEAAVVNLTGVAGTASTYLSLFPTNSNGTCTPTGTSTINLLPGAVRADRVMVKLGPTSTGGSDDAICVYNAAGSINVLVDANGWFGSATATATPAGYQYQALAPTRICDTRQASPSCASGLIGGNSHRLITVAGHDGVPDVGVTTPVVAMIANLTAVAPSLRTYLTVYPSQLTQPPNVSDLNAEAGMVLPNLAVVALDPTNGDVSLYNGAGNVNAILDLEGWFQ